MKTMITKLFQQQQLINHEIFAFLEGTNSSGTSGLNTALADMTSLVRDFKGQTAILPLQAPPDFSPKGLKSFRKSIQLNQQEFWSTFGVTQSGGSRYENGRAIPASVLILITLFVNKVVTFDQLKQASANAAKHPNVATGEED